MLLFNLNQNEHFTQGSTIKLASLKNTLKHLMYRSGIVNSSQLHRYTGISIPTIDKILNEETISPNHNTLSTIADFFNVSIAQLKGIDHIPKGKVSTYVKVIVYFVPTFFSISASEFLKFSKFKYAENGIH